MATVFPSANEINRRWLAIDAANQRLGRLASEVASILQGKTSPLYTPFIDVGSHVVVYNASQIVVSGRKEHQKTYFTHTGRPGSGRTVKYSDMLRQHPDRIVAQAVKGMLPKSKLGRQMAKKLKVYPGVDHPHIAQQPTEYFCEHHDLRNPTVFLNRLSKQYSAWVATLPDNEKRKPYLSLGGKSYSPLEIVRALEEESEVGRFYSSMMYNYHFADFEQLRDKDAKYRNDIS